MEDVLHDSNPAVYHDDICTSEMIWWDSLTPEERADFHALAEVDYAEAEEQLWDLYFEKGLL